MNNTYKVLPSLQHVTEKNLVEAISKSQTTAEVLRKLDVSYSNARVSRLKEKASELGLQWPIKNGAYDVSKSVDRDKFKNAVENSISITQIIAFLNLPKSATGFRQVQFLSQKYHVELPKYGVSGPKTSRKIRQLSDEEFFIVNVSRSGVSIRNRLLKLGWDYICDECDQPPEWNGKTLTLQVDHKNGNHFDNTLANLHFLCPNCHTQTETHGSKNVKFDKVVSYCACGKEKNKESIRCMECYLKDPNKNSHKNKISWTRTEEIIEEVSRIGYVAYGKSLGVTDNAIRKHLVKMGVSPLPKFR